MAPTRAATPPGGGGGHQRIADRLAAHGVPAGASRQLLLRAIASAATRERPPPEAARGLVVWRGMTGQVLVEVQCKPQTTVLQVKRDISAKTGIPVEQQQLIGFGCTKFLLDDALISSVPRLEDCDGIQIVVDAPVRRHWADICEQEAGAVEPPGDAQEGRGRASASANPGKGPGKGPGRGRGEPGAKLQRHFILGRGLQERDFEVLARVRPRTRAIWQATNVSLRLHGPGSGQPPARGSDERHLMLSLSAKRGDADAGAFHQAVQQAEDLIRSLNEQYRGFCAEAHRRVPALGVHCEAGYRRGSHKPR